MIEKDELIDKIETTKLERKQNLSDSYEKNIYLDDDLILIVGYNQEESFEKVDQEEETRGLGDFVGRVAEHFDVVAVINGVGRGDQQAIGVERA